MSIRITLLCALAAAGCASGERLKGMSVAEVCYLGATEREYRRAADDELKRRGQVCENYRDEIVAIHNKKLEAQRASRTQGEDPKSWDSNRFPQDTMVRPGVLR